MSVQVISRDGCQPCVATHRRLAKLQVDYTSVDASDESAIAQARSLGRLELPVAIVTDETGVIDSWAGFSPDRLAALAASHTPKKEHRMSENNTPEATDATRTITVDGMKIEIMGRESILDRGEAGLRAGWEADKVARQADEPEGDEDAYQARLDAEDKEERAREKALDALVEVIEEVAVGYEVVVRESGVAVVYDPDEAKELRVEVNLESEPGKPFTPDAFRKSLPDQLADIQGLHGEFPALEDMYEEDDARLPAMRRVRAEIFARHDALEARLAQISAE